MCHLLAKCSTPSAIFTSFIFVLFFKCCTLVTNTTTTQKHQCRDGRENLAEARSDRKSHYPVVIKHLRGTLYRPNNRPACYNGRATVLMPGVAKLFEGEMTVPQRRFDLVKSGTIRMTIKSPSFDDPICLNGSSQYKFLPDSMCSFNVCEFIGKDLCEFLQKPGIHTIREMEQKLHFNSTLLLPDPPSFLGISLLDILAGEFSFVMALETEGQTILELNIPTNERFLQIGLEEEENDDCN